LEAAVAETTIDVGALHAALERRRQARGQSWREIASELDLSPSTFSRLAAGHRPDVDAFATMLRWLGLEAKDFMSPAAGAEPSPEPLAAVSSVLRASRGVSEEQAEALEDIFGAAYRSIVRD
jgi:transcriptional regulator with XRE-family HTH domain